MTYSEKNDLERAIFYRHFDMMKKAVDDAEDPSVAFDVGRILGMMQSVLREWQTEDRG